MPNATELHVVFGAGQVGPLVARRLAAAGKGVRLVRRGEARGAMPGVQQVRADAADPASATAAAAGAAVLYHCMNPATYSAAAWEATLPGMQAGLVSAARATGARLVVLDNLYSLGRTGGRPMDERSPDAPCSRKGALRARLRRGLLEAAASGVRVAIGRASDFYGPGGVGTYWADLFWRPALAGKTVRFPANPDTPHTYHYIPDVAAGLAALGLDPEATGTFMLPCAPAVTSRELAARFASALGRPIVLARLSPAVLAVAGLFVPIVRELREMAYQWQEPFVVDDRAFRARFGDPTTPPDEAARATVAWAREAFGGSPR